MIKSYSRKDNRRQATAVGSFHSWRRVGAYGALLLALLFGAASAGAQQETPATININAADAVTLAQGLNGVGQSRAEAIVRYREAYGPFESVEELAEVKGIGAATVEQNRKVITLD